MEKTEQQDNIQICDNLQKITEALYRVTDLFSDKEPLKWQLRGSALELFDLLISEEIRSPKGDRISNTAEKARDLAKKLGYFLQLAYNSSAFISAINFKVLQGEYVALEEEIEKTKIPEIGSPETSKKEEIVLSSFYANSNGQSNGHLSIDKTNSNGHNGQPFDSNGHNGQIKEIKEIRSPAASAGDRISLKLRERQERILSALKGNGWATIRDISASLPEFGEKSIQRDLLEMAGAGILKKTGDKRWRKYSAV